jgi:hypothetical protein
MKIEGICTPFYLSEELHPARYLKHLQSAWPPLLTRGVVEALAASDRKVFEKQARAFIATRHDAEMMRAENDYSAALKELEQGKKDATKAFEAYKRLNNMSTTKYEKAVAMLAEVEQQSITLAINIIDSAKPALVDGFVRDVVAMEERLERYGKPLFTEQLVGGEMIIDWVLYDDEITTQRFFELWSLVCYFRSEFQSPHYEPAGRQWWWLENLFPQE